jgi:Arc/MetJ-type ribon-helix-helix transcriptional regulator
MVLAKVDPTNLKTWDEYYKTNKFAQGGTMFPLEKQPTYSSTMTTLAGSQSDINTGGVVAVPEEEARASTTTSPTKIIKMPPGMAKGGMLEEGGLLQEGGTVDPASGNEVPAGSLQEEVRDDIPAQLSEGEFVFPADVVRFIGLERLMKMRQAAKEGLQKMNDMGQMGNAEEATMDDGADTEFETEIDDILAEVKREGQQV